MSERPCFLYVRYFVPGGCARCLLTITRPINKQRCRYLFDAWASPRGNICGHIHLAGPGLNISTQLLVLIMCSVSVRYAPFTESSWTDDKKSCNVLPKLTSCTLYTTVKATHYQANSGTSLPGILVPSRGQITLYYRPGISIQLPYIECLFHLLHGCPFSASY